jgi:XRE family transcriptional regulator, regulator of sulfur utilization
LGAAVRRLRAERRLSQEQLAHEAGLTTAALARVERDQSNPTWATVRQIAAGLGVSLRELAEAVEAEDR